MTWLLRISTISSCGHWTRGLKRDIRNGVKHQGLPNSRSTLNYSTWSSENWHLFIKKKEILPKIIIFLLRKSLRYLQLIMQTRKAKAERKERKTNRKNKNKNKSIQWNNLNPTIFKNYRQNYQLWTLEKRKRAMFLILMDLTQWRIITEETTDYKFENIGLLLIIAILMELHWFIHLLDRN